MLGEGLEGLYQGICEESAWVVVAPYHLISSVEEMPAYRQELRRKLSSHHFVVDQVQAPICCSQSVKSGSLASRGINVVMITQRPTNASIGLNAINQHDLHQLVFRPPMHGGRRLDVDDAC
jgi:hypothetical protein